MSSLKAFAEESESFPGPRIGFCPRCGGDGGDIPAASLTGADAQSNIDTDRRKTVLTLYQGEFFCDICLKEFKDEEFSLIESDRFQKADELRAGLGFTNSIS